MTPADNPSRTLRSQALRAARRIRGGQARRRGRGLELLAAAWLMIKGYRLVAVRLKVQGVEVDVLARRGGALVLVEVKGRRTLEAALAAVSPAQQARLARAAEALAARAAWRGLCTRIDLMAFAPGRWPRHVRSAWGDLGRGDLFGDLGGARR